MALKTLDAMARGGIRDHLAGGYHRYSTVRDWSVPHFEKMLYDNAQLAEALVLAFEATGDPRWQAEAEATFAFVARTMTAPRRPVLLGPRRRERGRGGQVLRLDPRRGREDPRPRARTYAVFAHAYGLDGQPNFEGDRYVLLEPKAIADPALEARLAPLRAKLLAARDRRPAPAARRQGPDVLERPDDRRLCRGRTGSSRTTATGSPPRRPPTPCWRPMTGPDGRLLRTARGGQAKLAAYLEDYAFLTHALVRLHAATGDPKRLAQARALADRMIADFADPKDGGFFYTAGDHEALLARVKDPFDNAVPGANSVAIRALVGLGRRDRRGPLPRRGGPGPRRLRPVAGRPARPARP